MTDTEKKWLVALQEGIPLDRRPFEELSRELGCMESDLTDFIEQCRKQGIVRRFGAVFDTRRLGYTSTLCCATVPKNELKLVAEKVTPFIGVTHCYERVPAKANISKGDSAIPNLWFTLSEPSDIFDSTITKLRDQLSPLKVVSLPATRRYKIDVVFGAASRSREESTAQDMPITVRDRKIIRALQGDISVTPDLFATIAVEAGIQEWELLSTLEIWRRNGRLKRIGLLLAHRAAGFTANGMCCWRVDGNTTDAGRALAARPEVTHCYERPISTEFPFNLFAMVHTHSEHEAKEAFQTLEKSCGLSNGLVLISTTEFKKTSMTFFTH